MLGTFQHMLKNVSKAAVQNTHSLFPAFGCNSVRAKLRSFKAAATTLATLHTEAEARVETLLV